MMDFMEYEDWLDEELGYDDLSELDNNTAESEEEAMNIAKEMATDDFDWSNDIEVTGCYISKK